MSKEMECHLCGEEFNVDELQIEHMSVVHSQRGEYLQQFGRKKYQAE